MEPERAGEIRRGEPTGAQDELGIRLDPVSVEDFHHRFETVCTLLLDNPHMFGYCYTQLTDITPEENGIYDFDRKPKFDTARIRAIQERRAATEEA